VNKKIQADRVFFTIVLFLFGVITTARIINFSPKARWLPLGTGVIFTIIMAILVISEYSPKLYKLLGVYGSLTDEPSKPADDSERRDGQTHAWGRVFICWAWLVIFFVLIYLVGFFISIPLFTIVQLKVFSKRKWYPTIIVTLAIVGFVYFIATILNLELFPGIIFGGIVPPL